MDRAHPMYVPTVLFSEVQYLARNPIVLALVPASIITTSVLLLATAYQSGNAHLLWVWAGVTLFEILLFVAPRMRTTVTDRELRISFFPFYWKTIPVENIDTFEAVRYDALSETGGWGIRSSRRYGRVVNVRGNQAVTLTAGRTRMLIGTQRSDELLAALATAAGPR
jgi:hypothetical protein